MHSTKSWLSKPEEKKLRNASTDNIATSTCRYRRAPHLHPVFTCHWCCRQVAHVFGLQHAGEIYGIIWLSGGLVAPIPVFLTELLLQRFGYLSLFLTSAVFPALSEYMTSLGWPKRGV